MKTTKSNNNLHVYKVTFLKNQIDSCKLADDIFLEEGVSYQEYKGQLIYALIKAESETVAKEKANEIVGKFTR